MTLRVHTHPIEAHWLRGRVTQRGGRTGARSGRATRRRARPPRTTRLVHRRARQPAGGGGPRRPRGFTGHPWRLPRASSSYFGRSGRWRDWEATQLDALAAARASGDRGIEALTLCVLGRVYTLSGRYQEAVEVLDRALTIPAGDTRRAHAHEAISLAHERRGAIEDAHARVQLGRARSAWASSTKRATAPTR
ncbi:tetratricopeptide repeat protein [Actinosynnema sp. NPDC023794]